MSETRVDEIAPSIYRISTSVPPSAVPGGFTLNQFLVVDEEPLLFHTGGRRQFAGVREAVARVMPIERLRWIGFSHVEADECGSLNEWLAVAPHAAPVCGRIAALVSVNDLADRPPRALGDGESLALGEKRLTWIDAPHMPHAWECGFLFEEGTRTLLAGDLFTQGGEHPAALTEADILGPSEAFRARMDAYSHSSRAGDSLERMAQLAPATLACMHGSSYRGDGARLLRALAGALSESARSARI
jgi:flavorubredoxin